jgi:uncharacterized protein YkwD
MLVRSSSGCAALLIAALFLPPGRVVAKPKSADAAQALFDAANRERAARGLRPLIWSDTLAAAARNHALLMAQQNSISHQFPGEADLTLRATRAGARFSAIAENVAVGPSTAIIHAGWMKSPPHRANLLNPRLDSLGVAVSERAGQLFAVQDFSRAVPDLSIAEQEKEVGALLTVRGLQLLGNTNDARQVCATFRGSSAKRRPPYFTRYETSDLGVLPDNLLQNIQSGRYHSATVGACRSGDESGFASYRVAVLLY